MRASLAGLARRLAPALALSLALPTTGCVWLKGVELRTYRCYEGPLPPLTDPSLEKTELLRRDLRRERALPPAARGYWAEGMSGFASVQLPGGGYFDMCARELSGRFRERLSSIPLPYSREQVGLLRAVANLHTYEETSREAGVFDQVASLPDDSIAPYAPAPGEPPHPKGQLRSLATLCLASVQPHAGLTPEAERRLRAPLSSPGGALAALALAPVVREMIRNDYGYLVQGERVVPLARRRSADLGALLSLSAPSDEEIELALSITADLSHGARGDEAANDARLDEIVAARGRFPVTAGGPARALDLAALALAARTDRQAFELGRRHRLDSYPRERRFYLVDLVPFRSTLRRPWNDGWDRGTTLSLIGPEVRDKRLRVVFAELARARTPEVRCLLANEATRWSTPAEADAVRARLLEPVVADGALRLGGDLTCRFEAALLVDLDAERAPLSLVRRAIQSEPRWDPRAEVDANQTWTRDGACDGDRLRPRPRRVASLPNGGPREKLDAILRAALAGRPDLAVDPVVREFLERQEALLSADPLAHAPADPFVLTRTLLHFHGSSRPGASPAWGRRRLLELTAQIDRVARTRETCPYLVPSFAHGLFLLAEHAARFGLSAEASATLGRLGSRDTVCDSPHARAIAAIALWILAAPEPPR